MKNLPNKEQVNWLVKENDLLKGKLLKAESDRDSYKFGANLFLGTTLFFVVVSAFLTCLLIF